jgi:hypothetical protein
VCLEVRAVTLHPPLCSQGASSRPIINMVAWDSFCTVLVLEIKFARINKYNCESCLLETVRVRTLFIVGWRIRGHIGFLVSIGSSLRVGLFAPGAF